MAGLILSALLTLLAAPQRAGQDPAPHFERMRELLAAPRPAAGDWRGMLFQSLARLDHHPDRARVAVGWDALAASGADADLSNRILFLRRTGLPLPEPAVGEGVDCALERALAAWGAGARETCRSLLQAAAAAWPADDRVASNLLWLERRPPALLRASDDARACALAVLAARAALP